MKTNSEEFSKRLFFSIIRSLQLVRLNFEEGTVSAFPGKCRKTSVPREQVVILITVVIYCAF